MSLSLVESVLDWLRSAGWSGSKASDFNLESELSLAESRGIKISNTAQELLATCGGISIECLEGGITGLEFGLRGALEVISRGDVEEFESVVGERVSPAGYGGRFVLFLAETDHAYLLQDEWLCYVRANSLSDLLQFAFDNERSGVTIEMLDD